MIYSFLYVLIYSISAVLIQHLDSNVSPMFSLLISAFIATIFFNLMNISKLKETYKMLWSQKTDCIGIMITVLIMWACTMTTPGLIGASMSNFLYFAWQGMIGLLILGTNNRLKLYMGIFIGLLIIFTMMNNLYPYSKTVLEGMLLAILGGTTGYVYCRQSQALVKKIPLKPTQILSFRFYLTIFALYTTLPKGSFIFYSSWKNYAELLLLAVLGLIVPLFFQQKALEKISSEQNAIIVSLCPVIIAFFQEIVFRDVNFRYLIIYLLYTCAIALPYIAANLNKDYCKS